MRRALLIAGLVLSATSALAQAPDTPRVIKDIDTEGLNPMFAIVRSDYDPAQRQITWLVESRTEMQYPRMVARFFDKDDVEFQAKFLSYQHGSRPVGERTRVILGLPVDPDILTKTKTIVITRPVYDRE